MLTLIRPDYTSHEWEILTNEVKAEVRAWLDALSGVSKPGLTRKLHEVGRAMGSGYATARRKHDDLLKSGGDWKVLIDRRKLHSESVQMDGTASPLFRAHLVETVERFQRNNAAAFRDLKRRWMARQKLIPGYEDWPGWPAMPTGWHKRNLDRIVKAETNRARLASIRVGTSSKTNPFLPTVATTRVGLWPGAIIQFDDQWHDNFVTLGRRRELVRVIELGALDLLSGHRFHWGAKPRRKRDGSYENIRKRDMLLFAAGMLHRFGYSARGSMWMVEHGTAAVSEFTEKLLYDATGGLIRIERQPIEGKQAALCGFWPGSEGGNFRAKACLESTHNLIRNDMAALPLQSGSPSSGLKGPVTTDRQIAYITKVVADLFQKVPHREQELRLPAWDFHTQLIPWLTDYYQIGLAMRTDHQLEGWERLGYVINEYTALPGSGAWMNEAQFLDLDRDSQLIITNAVRRDPAKWSRRRNLSPLEVWNNHHDGFQPVPASLLCEMLTDELAKEITVRNGFIEFSDEELSPDELIYKAKFVTGPRARQEIASGEKVKLFANPYDDTTAFVVDAHGRYQGEVPLYKRVLPIDPAAFQTSAPFEARPDVRSADLTRAAGEKHQRTAEILEPTRILHREEVREAREIREHNRRLIAGEPLTESERRAAGALQAPITAAANRLQAHGEAIDWDTFQPEDDPEIRNAWDDLPDETDLPEAF